MVENNNDYRWSQSFIYLFLKIFFAVGYIHLLEREGKERKHTPERVATLQFLVLHSPPRILGVHTQMPSVFLRPQDLGLEPPG